MGWFTAVSLTLNAYDVPSNAVGLDQKVSFMPNAPTSLGGRAELIDPAALTDAQKALYNVIIERWAPWAETAGFKSKLVDGRLIGPCNLLLLSPAIAGAFLELQRVESEATTLSKRVREVVILLVGAAFRSGYERYAHSAVARQVGLSEDAVQALCGGRETPGLSAEEDIARRFALALSRRHHVGGAQFDEVKSAFGDRGIVDMVMLAACYDVVASLLNVYETPVPD